MNILGRIKAGPQNSAEKNGPPELEHSAGSVIFCSAESVPGRWPERDQQKQNRPGQDDICGHDEDEMKPTGKAGATTATNVAHWEGAPCFF
jgi:hypothetical protein